MTGVIQQSTIIIAFLFFISFVSPALADGKADLNAQLQRLLEWWPGHYDNHEQVLHHSAPFKPLNEKPFLRVHTLVQRIRLANLGDNQLLVTEYRKNNPKNIVRTELYVLTIDEQEVAIRVKRYAHAGITSPSLEPGQIEISPNTLHASEFMPIGANCDLLMHYVGGQFQGNVAPRLCTNGTEYIDKAVVVGDKFQWTREQRLDLETGKVTFDMAPDVRKKWFEQTRARLFTCIVLHNTDGDMTRPKILKTIKLHDQGDEVDIPWPDGRTLTFTIQTRSFTTPSDHQYPLFRVHEKNNPVPIAYAWANDGAKRFGINIGWFYIRCYEEGDVDPAEMRVRNIQK